MKHLLYIFAILFFSSCINPKQSRNSTPPLQNTIWHLSHIADFEMEKGLEKPPTLRINDQNVNGYGGCNGFGGKISISNNTLKLSDILATQRYCDVGSPTENKMLASFYLVDNYEIKEQKLLLKQGEKILLTFKSTN